MKVNKNENAVLIDTDQTIIISGNMYTANYYGIEKNFSPRIGNIELLKSYKARGYYIRVHSNNGWQWAEEIVNKLGL